jgi:hypothetical protein
MKRGAVRRADTSAYEVTTVQLSTAAKQLEKGLLQLPSSATLAFACLGIGFFALALALALGILVRAERLRGTEQSFPLSRNARMQAGELEIHATEELIAELMRRRTFLGVVVQSVNEYKDPEWSGKGAFKVHYNSNLDAEQACRLLEAVTESMDRYPSE